MILSLFWWIFPLFPFIEINLVLYYRYLITKRHQIPLQTLLVSLQFLEVTDIDLDEVECIVANLIFEGKIKGYIAHQHKKLVVSKQNAFPSLSTLGWVKLFRRKHCKKHEWEIHCNFIKDMMLNRRSDSHVECYQNIQCMH